MIEPGSIFARQHGFSSTEIKKLNTHCKAKAKALEASRLRKDLAALKRKGSAALQNLRKNTEKEIAQLVRLAKHSLTPRLEQMSRHAKSLRVPASTKKLTQDYKSEAESLERKIRASKHEMKTKIEQLRFRLSLINTVLKAKGAYVEAQAKDLAAFRREEALAALKRKNPAAIQNLRKNTEEEIAQLVRLEKHSLTSRLEQMSRHAKSLRVPASTEKLTQDYKSKAESLERKIRASQHEMKTEIEQLRFRLSLINKVLKEKAA